MMLEVYIKSVVLKLWYARAFQVVRVQRSCHMIFEKLC